MSNEKPLATVAASRKTASEDALYNAQSAVRSIEAVIGNGWDENDGSTNMIGHHYRIRAMGSLRAALALLEGIV